MHIVQLVYSIIHLIGCFEIIRLNIMSAHFSFDFTLRNEKKHIENDILGIFQLHLFQC